MAIDEAVKKALEEGVEQRQTPEFQKLSEFYETKKREGAVFNHGYTLPLIDTVGLSLHGPGPEGVNDRPEPSQEKLL